MRPYEPIAARKYTITHSDITGELFIVISEEYAEDQINKIRDEVRLSWEMREGKPALIGSVLVDQKGIIENAKIRNTIFYNEMPVALEALRQADRFLFEEYPHLNDAPVLIHFISEYPEYNKIYDFGTIGSYEIKTGTTNKV